MQKLRLVYPDPNRPVPQLLTEDGIDLVKILPITQITIVINPFEFPVVTLQLTPTGIDCDVPKVTVEDNTK